MRWSLGVIAIAFVAACGPTVDVDPTGSTGEASATGSDDAPVMTTSAPVTTSPQPVTTGPVSTTGAVSTTGSMSTTGATTTTTSASGDSSGWLGSGSSGNVFSCGDGEVNTGEQCDGENLQGLDCAGLGLGGGALHCTPVCTFDTSSCVPVFPDCGNGVVNPSEQCDGDDVQGFDCADLALGKGELGCTEQCNFDTSGCSGPPACGDGEVAPGEQCDGDNLQGLDCESLGLGGGTLTCNPVQCTFDTSGCDG